MRVRIGGRFLPTHVEPSSITPCLCPLRHVALQLPDVELLGAEDELRVRDDLATRFVEVGAVPHGHDAHTTGGVLPGVRPDRSAGRSPEPH